jgi:hypothetical protein
MNDLDLLRQYEPVVRYTTGEMFFPCATGAYIQQCSLWRRDPNGVEAQLVAPGRLTAAHLAASTEIPPGHTLYLRFVREPLDGPDYQKWRQTSGIEPFTAPGRLARVGLTARLMDALFDLSLLVRGRVPGGTTAAAHQQYMTLNHTDPRRVYYGRVVRDGGYIILHYLFFYAMNNWRSTFSGVNDHEADWEQVFVYLAPGEADTPAPCWVAYASHDYSGDDLRRRWDDPHLEKVNGTHPVVYAGAGSHASYFQPGEYLMHVQPAFLLPLKNFSLSLRRFWNERLGQGDPAELSNQIEAIFSVPFVDYARGDGLAVGPGQPEQWSPVLLQGEIGWVDGYRGLWGLDTKDPFGGERAPAGPKYNRDGTIRQSWHNPLGWAGLQKVTPQRDAARHLSEHIQSLEVATQVLDASIETLRDEMRLLELEVRALHATDHLEKLHDTRQTKLTEHETELNARYTRRAEIAETLAASRQYLRQIEAGDLGDPVAHIRHHHRPEPPMPQRSRLVEFWAAVSAGLMLLVFALSLIIDPGNWLVRVGLVVALFLVIEATLRGRLVNLLLSVTIALGVLTALLLIRDFLGWVVFIALILTARLLIADNLRELSGR